MRLRNRSGRASRSLNGRARRLTAASCAAVAALGLAACGSSSSSSSSSSASSTAPAAASSGTSSSSSAAAGGGGGGIKAVLILKTFSNPYFVWMEKAAKADASAKGVNLTVSAGTADGDTATQITAIDNAIAAGDKGVIITPNGNAVN